MPGFDSPVGAGVNGSFFNLNFGSPTLNPKSSITYTVAYLYATSLAELRTVAAAAVARYNLATSVETANAQIPDRFSLSQNYPNPFNPSTVISLQLPVSGQAKLVVFDLLGREVATLTNGYLAAGEHSFRFDGSKLSSGIYFCRLTAGSFVATTKMVLQK
ncbi:MAG: T9SS type A sorting domain-containing protein [Ignavibacteriae bacterium]|nr:T9SS type A sorting domain-containing protein [Ignavibacteriota bacterium]